MSGWVVANARRIAYTKAPDTISITSIAAPAIIQTAPGDSFDFRLLYRYDTIANDKTSAPRNRANSCSAARPTVLIDQRKITETI
jgi:hypothetical protein